MVGITQATRTECCAGSTALYQIACDTWCIINGLKDDDESFSATSKNEEKDIGQDFLDFQIAMQLLIFVIESKYSKNLLRKMPFLRAMYVIHLILT